MEKRHFTENQKKLIGGVAIVIFVVFSAAICWFVGKPMVKFVSEPEKFRMWVDSHGLWSQVAYVGMTLLQVLVAVIPGEPLEISGGYAFGAVQGTVLCMLGAFLGSVVVFAFVRRFGDRYPLGSKCPADVAEVTLMLCCGVFVFFQQFCNILLSCI